jgi:hypothetical protein
MPLCALSVAHVVMLRFGVQCVLTPTRVWRSWMSDVCGCVMCEQRIAGGTFWICGVWACGAGVGGGRKDIVRGCIGVGEGLKFSEF